MKLRKYQVDAVDAIWDYFKSGQTGNPIAALPTGTGKSLIIGAFIKSVFYYYPTQRVMMLTHVKELIEQNFEKLIAIWPTAPAGIYSAGLRRKDAGCPITFAGIGSVAKKAKLFGHIDLIVVDECHLISPNGTTQYNKFIEELKKINPHLKVIGLTATPYRLGLGNLAENHPIFTDICFNLTSIEPFNELVADGYLAPLIPKPTKTKIDVDNVSVRGGEFVPREVQAASDREEITYAALQETIEVGGERKHWLIFATGIDHAIHIKEALESLDISCGIVHGKLTGRERDEAIRLFKIGYYQAMVNVGVLTTGFDFPEIDLIVMLRPTSSPGLWVQMLGRGTRPAEGKENCLVLDFAGNTMRLGPINDPVLPKKKGKGGGEAPVKVCPRDHGGCNTYIHASLRICPHCGHEFPVQIKFKKTAGTEVLIAGAKVVKPPEIHEFKVDRVILGRHKKAGSCDSIKVTYYCGLRVFNTWVCLWHSGFAKKKALDWWKQAHPDGREAMPPEDIEQALDMVLKLKVPETIRVQTDLKYPQIISYKYE